MSEILITGGAGFIGRRLALALRNAGHGVAVFDNLHSQVHPDPAPELNVPVLIVSILREFLQKKNDFNPNRILIKSMMIG